MIYIVILKQHNIDENPFLFLKLDFQFPNYRIKFDLKNWHLRFR